MSCTNSPSSSPIAHNINSLPESEAILDSQLYFESEPVYPGIVIVISVREEIHKLLW